MLCGQCSIGSPEGLSFLLSCSATFPVKKALVSSSMTAGSWWGELEMLCRSLATLSIVFSLEWAKLLQGHSSCTGVSQALTLLTRKRKRGCPRAACVDPVRHGMECWLVSLESLYTLPLPCTDLSRHVRKTFHVLKPWLACVSPSVSSALLILENRGSRYRHIPAACLSAARCLLGVGIHSPSFLKSVLAL